MIVSEQKIVVLTFTNAAADEFRGRLQLPAGAKVQYDLNQSQREAVMSDASTVVVMSGPGSGKTRTAIARVARFGNPHFCGTLHSYCYMVLRKYGKHIGYGDHGNIAVLSPKDRLALLYEVRDRLGYKCNLRDWYESHVATDYSDKYVSEHEQVRQIWAEFRFVLKRNNLVDYDLILREAHELLCIPEVRVGLAFDHLVVEEAQDSAAIDWALYRLLPAANRFIIGDIDQSIFEWRGGDPMAFLELTRQPGVTTFRLEENYRCGSEICRIANNLIRHNKARYGKETVSATLSIGEVMEGHYPDDQYEAEAISEWISDYNSRSGMTVAVLYRTNWDADRMRQFLSTRFRNVIQKEFNPPPMDWSRALILIGLSVSPYNEILAEHYLKLDRDEQVVKRMKLEAQATGQYLSDNVPKFKEPDTLLQWLAKNGVSGATIDLIAGVTRQMPADATPADLLHELHGVSFNSAEEKMSQARPESGGIYVGTIHSAKGREFDAVFLPAQEDFEMFESGDPRLKRNVESERRLLFVGITRARVRVHVTWAEQRRTQWSGVQQRRPSRFIAELNINTEDRNEDSSSDSDDEQDRGASVPRPDHQSR